MADGGAPSMEAEVSRGADDRRDMLGMGISIVALLLLLGSEWAVIRSVLRSIDDGPGIRNIILIVGVLLNIALALLGWQRFRTLKREIARRRTAEGQARLLATRDPLTGVLNRRALSEYGAQLIEQGGRRLRPVAMLMIDLDHFKSVNDRYGHTVGDLLLRAATAAITAPLPVNAITARLGGDEFACAFTFDPAQPASVDAVADAIISRIAEPFEFNGLQTLVSASMGIARTEADCRSIDALMRRSDIALYAAKRAGRNQRIWFDASMERELELRNAIEQGLRAGIPQGEVVPYFEPQVDLITGALIGFEMLARWEHPEHGLTEPAMFIPVAEESGLIGELSMSVMRAAMEEARDWDPTLRLAVNISPAQMRDPWLSQKILKLLTETRFPAERLEIEITEAALFENLGLAQSIIGSMKNQGIQVALDDFGTGYSSLTHLRALPLDRIKIDRSFVTAMDGSKENMSIVATITTLASSLNVPVMAEGVETEAIHALLCGIGCTNGQGWYLGRPMTARQARHLLGERGLLAKGAQLAMANALVSTRQDQRRAI
jgi:diguanylate cyclase (GGDEF)-like protein